MLPFGSLLTQIPLIIIGALYMLYLGVYAVNKSKAGAEIAESGVNELFISKACVEDSNTIYLTDTFLKGNKDVIAATEPVTEFYESYFEKSNIIPKQELYSHRYSYFLFSRPPPVI